MTFPTIPTVAAGRVLFTNQADTSATRTFPNLSSLTKNSGDLLLAIIVTYQSTGNPQFSSWGGGFTEISDQGSSTTLGIGVAWKISDGTETGTFTVTQAATITGHASMCLMSIPGAHGTTAPEVGTIANGTAAAADPGSFNPSGWDVEDTLWIAVDGNGMTSGTGSWTACGAGTLTNYSNQADSNTTDSSTTGQTEIVVSFRQNAAASEDRGAVSTHDLSNARNSALIIAVRPMGDVAKAGTDGPSLTFTDSSAVLAGSSGTDAAALTLTESSTNLVSSDRPDSVALTFTDASSVQAVISGTDSAALTLTDVAEVGISVAGTDSVALTLSEGQPTILVDITTWEDGAAWATETTEWNLSNNAIAGTDAASLTFTDVSTNAVSSALTDSAALTFADASTSLVVSDRPDSVALTFTDTSANLIISDRPDSVALTFTETSTNAISSSRTDSVELTFTDSSSLIVTLSVTDSVAVTLTEGTSELLVGLSRTDSVALTFVETSALQEALAVADSIAMSFADSASAAVQLSVSDAVAMTLTEAVEAALAVYASDAASLSFLEQGSIASDDWPQLGAASGVWSLGTEASSVWTKIPSVTNTWS